MAVPALHVFHQGAQQRLPLPGAVVHAFLDTSFADPVAADVGVGDRARRHPDRPSPGFRGGPRLQVGVEGADRSQDGIEVAAAFAVGADRDLVTPPLVEIAVDAQVGLAGGELLDGRPEVAGQVPGQVVQRRVVQLGFASFQVSDEQVPDPGVADLVPVDQLFDRQPPVQQRGLQRRRPAGREVVHRVEHLPGQVPGEPAAGSARPQHQSLAAALPRVVQEGCGGQVGQRDALRGERDRDVEQRGPVVDRVHRRGLRPGPELLQERVVLGGEETLPVVEEDVRPEGLQRRL